jgi:hypothetical protein
MAELWLCPEATALLDRIVTGARVFEFGMGGSTPWLAERALSLVSVDHSQTWYDRVKDDIVALGERAAEWELVLCEDLAHYPATIHRLGWFDVVIVDGRERVLCVTSAVLHIIVEGWLVLDDSERSGYGVAVKMLRKAGWREIIKRGQKAGSKEGQIVTTQTSFFQRVRDGE